MAELTEYSSEEAETINTFREQYYSLLTALFWREPDAALAEMLEKGLAERAEAAGQVHPAMGEGWRLMGEALAEGGFQGAAEEYTHLFLGPFAPEVAPYESKYLANGMFKAPLIEVREFMLGAGLEKSDADFTEPEDMLAFELEIMRWLVSQHRQAKDGEAAQRWLDLQADFAKQHLLVWGSACARDIAGAESARFYKGAALLLEGFLELETEVLRPLGPSTIPTLEEAIKRHTGRPVWKGPTFEA